ncbi:MAG: chemotaxis protein CheW [Pirellulales bacterium]
MNALETAPALNMAGRSSPTSRQLVVFRLAGQAYGIPLSAVKEIVSMPLLSRPPGLPSVLAGFFNLAGLAVAVLRLDQLFSAPNQAIRLYTPILVLQNVGLPLAVMVEDACILGIAESCILPVPENCSFNECAVGVAMVEDSHIIILSPDRLLLRTEQQRLADLAALQQARLAELEGGAL